MAKTPSRSTPAIGWLMQVGSSIGRAARRQLWPQQAAAQDLDCVLASISIWAESTATAYLHCLPPKRTGKQPVSPRSKKDTA
jgi:hypothetical protein